MCRRKSLFTSGGAVVLGLVISSATAFGQDSSSQEVMIRGAPVVTTEGWSRTGIQNQRLQLSENISYSDLNLATPAGASELKARLHDAANAICNRLAESDEPHAAIDAEAHHIECVNGAVDGAMGQVKRAIAVEQSQPRG